MCTSIPSLWQDREYAEELNRKADAMLEKYTKMADETFDSVLGKTEKIIKAAVYSSV